MKLSYYIQGYIYGKCPQIGYCENKKITDVVDTDTQDLIWISSVNEKLTDKIYKSIEI